MNLPELAARIRSVTEALDALDRDAAQRLDRTEALAANRNIFGDAEPALYSIFVYCDLSISVEVLCRAVKVRAAVEETLGPGCARYAELARQHCTIFTEIRAEGIPADAARVAAIRAKYEPVLRARAPFTLWVGGPHLTPDGGIILDCAAYSGEFFAIRDAAGRPAPRIIHSTAGYVSRATPAGMRALWEKLRAMRALMAALPVRVREAGIAASRNRRTFGEPVRIPFERRPDFEACEDGGGDPVSRRLAFEAALAKLERDENGDARAARLLTETL